MSRPAVDLHGKPLFCPQRIDSHSADGGVHSWKGETCALAELEEPLLERSVGLGQGGQVVGEGLSQRARTEPSAPEHGLDRRWIQEALKIRLGESPAKPAAREGAREVDEGSRDARDGEPTMLRPIDPARMVDTNTGQ
jgi:hypothetical protein